MENCFYTYIYLDPRKSGFYNYGNYVFECEPFYVGKGKNEQSKFHLKEAKYDVSNKWIYNLYKTNKIKKILQENLEPIILKVKENLSEQEAFELEIWLIWAIGRFNLKLGPLTNLTDGGEGVSGHPGPWKGKHLSKNHCKKLSDAKKGKPSNWKGKVASLETVNKLQKSHKGQIPWNKGKTGVYSKESLIKIGEKSKGRIPSIEAKDKMSKAKKGKFIPWNKGLTKKLQKYYKKRFENE